VLPDPSKPLPLPLGGMTAPPEESLVRRDPTPHVRPV
jgi:hypothetical protein